MHAESRWKRLGWCALSTALAAGVWLAQPLTGPIFFFMYKLPEDKLRWALTFFPLACAALYVFSDHVRKRNVFLVCLGAALAGLALSEFVLIVFAFLWCFTRQCGRITLETIITTPVIYLWISLVRGTFLFAVLLALVHRYLPAWIGWLRGRMGRG